MVFDASEILIFLVTLFATLLGPICGIGGGVIINPVIESFQIMPVAASSFLSSAAVMTMALFTIFQKTIKHNFSIDSFRVLPLAVGSAVGGVVGKIVFNELSQSVFPNPELTGAVQGALLVILCIAAIIFVIFKSKIKTLHVDSTCLVFLIGFIAGMLWSFLGIGGGPFNVALLLFFFSLNSKEAAQASLFIISFSQAANIIYSFCLGGVPQIDLWILFGMCASAVAGSFIGSWASKRMNLVAVDKVYVAALGLVLIVCIFNFVNFIQLASI